MFDFYFRTYMAPLFNRKKRDTVFTPKPTSRKEVKKDMESIRHYVIQVEAYSESVEKWYFWILEQLKEWGYDVNKTEDMFFASELSGLWGISSQRLSIQQEKAQQILGAINSMVKQIFQIVRSIRITKERLGIYREVIEDKKESADVTLKGLFIDMVQGSTKNPSSVYGMATQLGFTTLPDLFFNIHIWDRRKVDEVIEKSELVKTQNQSVINALKRHLKQFLEWRDKTYEELKTSERFYLSTLRQQVNAIKMYIDWAKPYLKVINKLKKSQYSDDVSNKRREDVLTAFDTSTSDLEIFAVLRSGSNKKRLKEIEKKTEGNNELKERYMHYEVRPVIKVSMHFRSAPVLTTGREYQRTPTHIGRCEIDFDAYVMNENQIDAYIQDENNEAFELLTAATSSLESLGDELNKYLKEAEEIHKIESGDKDKKEKEKKTALGLTKELNDLKEGFAEIFIPIISPLKAFSSSSKKSTRKTIPYRERKMLEQQMKENKNKAKKILLGSGPDSGQLFTLQKLFRKAHKLLTW